MAYSKVDSIRQMMQMAATQDGDKCAFKYRLKGKRIAEVTFSEFYDDTRYLVAGLCELGLGDGHIACAAKNSYRWIVSYMARLQSAGVFVPVDKELPPEEIINVLTHSDTHILFYSKKYEKLLEFFKENLPNVKYFIAFDKDEEGDRR